MWSSYSRRLLSNTALSRKEQFVQNLANNGTILPTSRNARRFPDVPTKSSVLIPVVEIGTSSVSSSSPFDNLSVVLTKRSSLLRAHRGEICFPGGKCDKGETLEETALRETHEETGMEAGEFELWSRLEPVMSSRFDRSVMPIIAELKDASILDRLIPNYDEVDYVFSVPVKHLISNLSHTLFVHPKFNFRLPVFQVDQFKIHTHSQSSYIPSSLRIWGLSGIILHQALTHIAPSSYNSIKVQFY
ncbi:hypothetical protein PFISCL1PPCAC_5722 [Pristionchus fissidentatus]|uniref:Nudix hydrolase domain-containing protein n=1 Tax=Pristionchus fissidentatus TaxID=1538716 RepID=A0AAV5V7A5_9BILA|nr:hypothetical protein PFISCL1PPCAC_5722 [Pristionchus fissidentatus]